VLVQILLVINVVLVDRLKLECTAQFLLVSHHVWSLKSLMSRNVHLEFASEDVFRAAADHDNNFLRFGRLVLPLVVRVCDAFAWVCEEFD
jgi:hypothetical protein